MPHDVIAFPGMLRGAAPAWDALQEFRRLAATLAGAVEFRRACAARRPAARWRVPPLYFFNSPPPDAAPPAPGLADGPVGLAVARRSPLLARAWADLRPQLVEAFDRLTASASARHVARAVPGLVAGANALAADRPDCRELADLLAVADDFIVNAVHPEGGRAYRVRLRGVSDLAQFHLLLSDAVGTELPGDPPDERVADAYRDCSVDPACDVATVRFQLWHPDAWQAGRFPPPFAGSDLWFWGHESPKALPTFAGDATVFLGQPAYPRQWAVGRTVPRVRGELDVLAAVGAGAARRAA